MQIYQEYMQRHSLDVPVVKHISSGTVFFKESDRKQWHILHLDWQPAGIHPGFYKCNVIVPNHDHGESSRPFHIHGLELHFDEYESHFAKLRHKKAFFAANETEVYLAAWQMFCYLCDSLMSRFAAYDCFYKSLDPKVDSEDRYKNLNETLALIEQHYGSGSPCMNVWRNQLLRKYINDYAYDLAKTLN